MSIKILFLGGIALIGLIVIGLLIWAFQAFMDRDS